MDVDRGNLAALTKEDFQAGLEEFFPSRSVEEQASLLKAAETELDAKEAETLDYKALFMEVETINSGNKGTLDCHVLSVHTWRPEQNG